MYTGLPVRCSSSVTAGVWGQPQFTWVTELHSALTREDYSAGLGGGYQRQAEKEDARHVLTDMEHPRVCYEEKRESHNAYRGLSLCV